MNISFINFLTIVFSVLLNAAAQLFLKAGMGRVVAKVGDFSWASSKELPQIIFQVLTTPLVLGGLCCYAVSVVVWMFVLSRVAVNLAYPMLSIGYIVVAVSAYYLFGEALTPIRIAGIVVIIVGVVLINQPAKISSEHVLLKPSINKVQSND